MEDREIVDFLKGAYEFEHQRKDALNSRLSLVFTAITVMIGAAVYFVTDVSLGPLSAARIMLFGILVMLLLTIAFALYFLFRCLFLYKYRYLARPDRIEDYIRQLDDYRDKSESAIDLAQKVYDLLRSQYASAASKNRANNNLKHAYFMRALIALFLAAIFIGLAAIPHYVVKAGEPKKPLCINITNLSEIVTMLNQDETHKPMENTVDPEPEPQQAEPLPPEPDDIYEAEMPQSDIQTKTGSDD